MKQVTIQNGSGACARIDDGFSLLNLAQGWLAQGNSIVGLELLKSAMESSEAQRDHGLRAAILKETGRAYTMSSDWTAADFHYQEAQHLFLMEGQLKGAAECARNRANMWFQRGDYKSAELLCEEALSFTSELEDHALRASILNTLGALKSATGDYAEALKTLKMCLASFENSGNRIRQGYVALNIGLTHIELHQFREAIEFLNRALRIALEEKDLQLVEIAYQNIARCYLEQNELPMARSVSEVARKILPGLNSAALETELALIESRILRLSGHLDDARRHVSDSLQRARDHSLAALEPELLIEAGLIEKAAGQSSTAVHRLESALSLFKSIGHDRGIHQVIQHLNSLKGIAA